MVDPAPAVDRYERALLQEIDEHDADGGDGPAGRSGQEDSPAEESLDPDRASPAEPSGPGDRNFVAIAGLGELPLNVSASVARERAVDLDALLAALPGSSRSRAEPNLAADEDLAVDPLLVSLTLPASSAPTERRAAPDYLTSACILAIGMGLTAGPLIPDLLRLIPSRSSRWRIAPAGAPEHGGGIASRDRGFGDWLRRRIV